MAGRQAHTFTRQAAIVGADTSENTSMSAKHRIAGLATMLERRYNEHPIQPDLFSDHETLQGWWYLNQAYPIVEMALKLLTDQIGTPSHDISKLFERFSEQSPIKAHKVEQAVWEYVVFYNVDIKAHPEFGSARSFLEHIGNGQEYIDWRYWPVEDGELKPIWPALLVEIVTSLRSVLLDKEPRSVSQRILFHVRRAISDPNRWVDTLDKYDVDGRTLIVELENWQQSQGGLLKAFENYLQGYLDRRWSEALEEMLYGAYQQVSAIDSEELRHFLVKHTDNDRTGPRKEVSRQRKPRPELNPAIPRLVKAEARDPYMLWVEFDDGTSGLVDMRFEDQSLPSVWQTPDGWTDVRVEHDVPVWSGWYDACPFSIWRQLTGQPAHSA